MHRLAPLALALALTTPALAEEPSEGFSLMEEGAKLVLRGLMAEMEPALDEMGDALAEAGPILEDLGPQFAELLGVMDDLRNYHPPEVQPNGDILIRRKRPGAPDLDPTPGPNGEIEL